MAKKGERRAVGGRECSPFSALRVVLCGSFLVLQQTLNSCFRCVFRISGGGVYS